jgi:peptidoglycan hydrolase CwlO-like protein
MQKITAPTPIERLVTWVGSIQSLIVHTIFFAVSLTVAILGLASWDSVLLVLTTAVSLEAIYLAIFIQLTVNRHTQSLREVEEDVDEIQEDIEDIGEDIEGLEKDVDEIQEDIEDITEDEEEDEARKKKQADTLDAITGNLLRLLDDVEKLKTKR